MQTIKDVKALRQRSKKNQIDFWQGVGVTQSGGSRYENGRRVPKPTRTLVDLAYGKSHHEALKALAKLRGVTVAELVGRK